MIDGSLLLLHFNEDAGSFVLSPEEVNFSVEIRRGTESNLTIRQQIDTDVIVNTQVDDSLTVKRQLEFTVER